MPTAYFQQGREQTISYPVTVDGITTRIVESGEGENVLFCLHGVGSRADRFIPVMPSLTAAGFRVLAMDFPGHGLASKPEGYGYRPADFARFVAGVLDALGLQQVTLVGTSLGGQVAATVACDRADLVESLVLIGTMGIVPMSHEHMVAPEKVSNGSPEAVRNKLALVVSSPDQVVEAWVREESQINSSAGAKNALDTAARALNEDSVVDLQTHRLRGVRPELPILIVWGAEDQWTPLPMGYASHDALPGSHLEVISGCGHAPYFENPEKFTSVLVEFFAHRHQPSSDASVHASEGEN